MAKTLIMVGGAMGVGKTETCRLLHGSLNNSAFLDGDWCWDMHPFTVTDETKAMVQSNIAHILNGFIACSETEVIIFCWVMHRQEIINGLLNQLALDNVRVLSVSLIASPAALTNRLNADIAAGKRTPDVIARSLERLPQYAALNTVKIDTSCISAAQAAQRLRELYLKG